MNAEADEVLVAGMAEHGERLLVLEPEQGEHREVDAEEERACERARDEDGAVRGVKGR